MAPAAQSLDEQLQQQRRFGDREDEEDPGRLFIKQVIIHGFKTYKDQTPLPENFHPGSNIVVGFNGSGKSNFFNAILFVISDEFGQLRPETKKALLHEGAGTQVLTAYVELVFCNKSKKLPIDREEVKLRRVIGTAKDQYILDGKTITKSEVFNLLESAGFAKNNPYYIVKQGKVQEMTVMSDEKRLSLLQEIAGVTIFDERKAQSLAKKADIVKRKEANEEKIDKMQKRVDELADDQKELLEWQKLDRKSKAIEFVDAEALHKEKTEKMVEIEKELQQLGQAMSEAQMARLEGEAAEMEGEKEKVNIELSNVQGQMKDQKDRLEQADADCMHCSGKMQEATRLKAVEEQEIAALKTTETIRKEELADCEKTIAEKGPLEEMKRVAVQEKQKTKTKLDGEKRGLDEKKRRGDQYSSVAERNKALTKEIAERKKELEIIDKKIAENGQEEARLEDEISALQKEQDVAVASAEDIRSKKLPAKIVHEQKVNAELDAMKERKTEKQRELQQRRMRLAQADKELVNSERVLGSLSRVVKKAFDMVHWNIHEERGDLKHLRSKYKGTLLQNITVAEPYRLAVEMCLSGALWNVIMEDDAAAAEVMQAVLAGNWGKMEVTPLNQVKHRQNPRRKYPKIIDEENGENRCQPMIDVIDAPDWLAPVLQPVAAGWVICKDLGVAKQVAQQGFNAITIDGDKEMADGVISGGKVDRSRYQMLAREAKRRGDEEKKNNLSKEASKLEEECKMCESEVWQQEKLLAEVKRAKDEVHAQEQRHTEEKKRLMQVIARNVTEKQNSAEERLRKATKKQEIEQQIEHKQNEMKTKDVNGLTDAEHVRLKQASEQLLVAEEELASSEAELAELRKFLKAARDNKASKEVELDFAVKALQQKKVSSEHDDTIREWKEKLAEYSVQRDQLAQELNEVTVQNELRLAQQLNVVVQKHNALLDEMDKIREAADDDRAKRHELENQRTDVAKWLQKAGEQMRNHVCGGEEVEKYRQMGKNARMKENLKLRKKLKDYENINKKALDQYRKYYDVVESMKHEASVIEKDHQALEKWIQEIDDDKHATLDQTIEKVDKHFQECFRTLVRNGDSRFNLMKDKDTKRVKGIRVEVAFTGKKANYLPMNQLSGGQKTVVALALIFAIQRLEPAPFYLFDEIDANLDTMYRSSVAALINKEAENCQMILTTFRPELIEGANRFYRVYMKNRTSRIDCVTKKAAKDAIAQQTKAEGLDN